MYKKPPVPETCNYLDDDCNRVVDDGCVCAPGDKQPYGTNGMFGGTCAGHVGPSTEVCDGRDDDSPPVPCAPLSVDTDMDPVVSREYGVTWGAVLGLEGSHVRVTVGDENRECPEAICPIQTDGGADAGADGDSGGQDAGGTDAGADDRQNDCNRVVDDGCVCAPGDKQPCGTDEGVCRQGEVTCDTNGMFGGTCAGHVGPSTEVCDGRDLVRSRLRRLVERLGGKGQDKPPRK